MTSTAAAEKVFAQVAAGRTVFTTLTGAGWTIAGPTADVQRGAWIPVTKADGTTKTVQVNKVIASNTVRGIAYAIAEFSDIPAASIKATPKTSALYGAGISTGRGDSLYDNGTTQIWDES